MKKFLLAVLAILVLAVGSNATVIWQDTFDGFTQDWNCALGGYQPGCSGTGDCSADCPGEPSSNFYGFKSNNADTGVLYPYPSSVTTDAARVTGTNKRGFRIKLRNNDIATPHDNYIGTASFSSQSKLYVRWYMRDSFHDWAAFQKLFRVHSSSAGQISTPEWKRNNTTGKTTFNMPMVTNGYANNYFDNFDLSTLTVNTWHCYEFMMDFPNQIGQFWVDGVSQGQKSLSTPTNTTAYRVEIGGNQNTQNLGWGSTTVHTRDYDDVVIANTYIGLAGGEEPPTTFTVGGATSGLTSGELSLKVVVNGGTTYTKHLTTNTSYSFTPGLEAGDTYVVTVEYNPMSQKCTVSNGSGTISSSNVTNANVACVGSKPSRSGGRVTGGVSR